MAFQERRGYGGQRSSAPREMHTVVCSSCGNETQVPFQPTEGRPVYCRDCFEKNRGGSDRPRGGGGPRADRQMFDATCAKCGDATQVPFQPTSGRPVYCRDCFAETRGPRL